MYENDVDAAEFVTFEDVTVTSRRGKTTTKRVKVAVDMEDADLGQIPPAPDNDIPPAPDNDIPHGLDVADEVPIMPPKPRKVNL